MMPKQLKKPWGWEKIVEQNNKYVVKELFMKKDHCCSRQYHEYKTETIYVLQGKLKISIGNGEPKNKIYNATDRVTIYPQTIHRMYGETDCLYLECSTTELDDVVRIEDDYGRV